MPNRIPRQLTEWAVVVTMGIVLFPIAVLLPALANPFLYGFLFYLAPVILICTPLLLDATAKISHRHHHWSWADFALGFTIVAAGCFLWSMAWHRATGDVDPGKGVAFAIAAAWLATVATATASIARSLIRPRRRLPPPPPPPPLAASESSPW